MIIDIRRPGAGDFKGIFECLAVYNLRILGENARADSDFSEDAIISVRNSICDIDLSEKCWVADEDGLILGFCCWDWLEESAGSAKTILISALPKARSLGVGKYLQKRRLDEMRASGAREVHTWSDDPAAIAWYRKMFGYQIVDYEPIRHCLHHFHFKGAQSVWALHRGFVEREELAHLRLEFDHAMDRISGRNVYATAEVG